jgi:hypothetical protein
MFLTLLGMWVTFVVGGWLMVLLGMAIGKDKHERTK